jgi:hypothetical protein
MAAHPLDELLRRLEGWTVSSHLPLPGVTQLHLTGPTQERPEVRTRAMVLIDGEAPPAGVIGARLSAHGEQVAFGDWTLARERIVAGQLLDTAIIEISGLTVDPLTEPTATGDHILTSGDLVWPDVGDRPEAYGDLAFLAGVTRTALTASPVLLSVETTAHGRTSIQHLYVTPWTALELLLEGSDDRRVVASYFALVDVPARLLERCGVTGLLAGADPTGTARQVEVRVTNLDREGLMLGALAWEDDGGGNLSTSAGPVSPQVIAAEVLDMLPGVAVAPVDVVGGR